MDNQNTLEEPQAEPSEFDFADPNTGRPVKLPLMAGEVNVKSLIEGVIAKSNKKAKDQYRLEIDNLRTQLSEFEGTRARLEEIESRTMNDTDRRKREEEKRIAEQRRIEEEKHNIVKALETEKLNNALFRIASKNPDIYDIEQTTDLFIARCKPSIKKVDDDYKIFASMDGAELDVDQAFSRWLDMPNNKNLLKNNLNPGGGTIKSNGTAKGKTINREQFNSMSPLERSKALSDGLTITD